MGDGSFGRQVKRRRDALGLSQARLGELVGRSASTIRNWERGRSMPSHIEDVRTLAAVLGVDEGRMLVDAGFDVPDTGAAPVETETHPTVEEVYASLAVTELDRADGAESGGEPAAPDDDEPADAHDEYTPVEGAVARADVGEEVLTEPLVEDRADTEPTVEDAPGGDDAAVDTEMSAGPADAEGDDEADDGVSAGTIAPVPDDETPAEPPLEEAPSEEAPAEEEAEGTDEADEVLIGDAGVPPAAEWAPDTEPVESEPEPEPRRAAPPTVLETAAAGEPSYLEDPDQRQQYRLRALITAAVVVGLAIVLVWSFDRATDILGDMWDQITGMLAI